MLIFFRRLRREIHLELMCAWGIICDYLRENRLFYTYDNNNNGRSHGNKGNKGNSLELFAHVILEKQSGNVPKGTKKKLQESCLEREQGKTVCSCWGFRGLSV